MTHIKNIFSDLFKKNKENASNSTSKMLLGAIAGDVIGSVYEFAHCRTTNFPLFGPGSKFTDDTVMTVAVASWLVMGGDKANLPYIMQEYGQAYPWAGYGSMFFEWLVKNNPIPYNSYGNGSAMRVSAVGWACDTLEETLKVAAQSATFQVADSAAVVTNNTTINPL